MWDATVSLESLGFRAPYELNEGVFPPRGPTTTNLSLYRPLSTTEFSTLAFLPYSGNFPPSCKFAIVILVCLSESRSMKDVLAVSGAFPPSLPPYSLLPFHIDHLRDRKLNCTKDYR